jgi:hypothetical protein
MTKTFPPQAVGASRGIPAERFAAGLPLVACNVPLEERYGIANSVFVLRELVGVEAVTDLGSIVPLFRYEALITPEPASRIQFHPVHDLPGFLLMAEQHYLDRTKASNCHLEKVANLNPAANCHGWTFAGGRFAVHLKYVPHILGAHGYEVVPTPRVGDLAIYRVGNEILHSGFVRHAAAEREVLVESKWGPFGVFLHPVDAHQGACTFYRTSRRQHTLKILSRAAA